MSGTPRLVVLVVALVGCARSEQPAPVDVTGTTSTPPAKQPPTTTDRAKVDAPPEQKRPVIRVGQPLDEALAALRAAQAEEFSDKVGIFIGVPIDDAAPRHEYRWFHLRDQTCLCVLIRTESLRGRSFVKKLELGEDGQGYGGKLRWLDEKGKHRFVNLLELP